MVSLILTLAPPLLPPDPDQRFRTLISLAILLQREHIALGSAAGDHPSRDAGDVRMMPERLSLVHIGNMHLDDRPLEGVQRIEDGD